MFFGNAFASTAAAFLSSPPPSSSIQTLTVQNAVFDELYVSVNVPDLSDFDGAVPAVWTFDTRLHAGFNGDLYGGNVSFSEQIVEAVRIKKRTRRDRNFQTIYEKRILKNEDFEIQLLDYLEPCGDVDYMYAAVISGGENNAVVNTVTSSFDSCFLCEKGSSYPLILDTDFSKQLNQRVSVVETWGRQYPLIVKNGTMKYYSGSIRCTFLEQSDSSVFGWKTGSGWEYRNLVYDFLTNGHPKILKDNEGNIYMIAVTGSAITEEKISSAYIKTCFEITECGNAYDTGDLYDNHFIDTDLNRQVIL